MAGYDGKACDICGKEKTFRRALMGNYATVDIKEICEDCMSDVNEQLGKLQEITFKQNEHWLKRFIVNLRIKRQK